MLQMFGFISTVVLIYLGMQYYVAFWLIRNFPGLPVEPRAVRIAVLLVSLSFPLSMYCLRSYRGAWTGYFSYLSYIWLGIVFIWLTCATMGDLALLLARLGGAAQRVRPLIAIAVLAAAALSSLWATYNAYRPPREKHLDIPLRDLPPELDGFTIVQLSDLHLGITVPLEKFSRVVQRAVQLRPDLVVLTGDILDAGLRGETDAARIGAGLQARCGVLAVLGNHEFYHGVEASSRAFRDMGARLLRNEALSLPGGLQVVGIDDIRTAGLSAQDVSTILARLDPTRPSLLISHQPLDFDVAARAGVGLMLSGHTHEGQIFPFNLIVRLVYPYFHGLYEKDGSWLYVTSGTGQWGPPMRLFTRAEIVRLTLRRRAAR